MGIQRPSTTWIGALLPLLLILACPPLASAETLPSADREGAERLFAAAYSQFLIRDYAQALENLDRALSLNTYFVDYYLMRGLVLRRMGRIDEAARSIRYYLEVRPRDSAAPRILERFWTEGLHMKEFIAGEPVQSRLSSSKKDVKKVFSLGTLNTLGIKGLGKTSSFGDGVFIADTFGDRVLFRFPGEEALQSTEANAPVVAIPTGSKGLYILTEEGTVLEVREGERAPIELGRIPVMPSDGALVSAGLMVVSSVTSRNLTLYSTPGLGYKGEIAFPEGERLFEPVAIAVYGAWLAVADRGNDRVFIQSLQDESLRFSIDVTAPRDLAWSSLGDLFILREHGGVLRARISFTKRMATDVETVLSESEQAWSLFSLKDRVYCIDISGTHIWEMFPVPLGDAIASLSISSPSISREPDRESFLMDACVSGPFITYMGMNRAVTSSIWNNRLLGGDYSARTPSDQGFTLFFKPPQATRINNGEGIPATSGKDLLVALSQQWHSRRGDVANVVVAASTVFSQADIIQFASFCLQNRIRIFVYADEAPSVELIRGSALTGGEVTFVPNGVWGPFPEYSSGKIRVVLPTDESSSGFPSRSTLSVYLDIGAISMRDWIPMWPDLL